MGVLSYLCKVLTFNVSNAYCLDLKKLISFSKEREVRLIKGGMEHYFPLQYN